MPHRFGNNLDAVQRPHRGQDVRRIGPLVPMRLEQLALTAPDKEGIEQELLAATDDQARAKLAQDRGIKARIRKFQPQHVLPIKPAAHSMRRLPVGQPFSELEDADERQAPGSMGRLPMRREEGSELLVCKQSAEFIGQGQVGMSCWKGGPDHARGVVRECREGRRLQHRQAPSRQNPEEISLQPAGLTSPAVSRVWESHHQLARCPIATP